jgi:hypothetical protein
VDVSTPLIIPNTDKSQKITTNTTTAFNIVLIDALGIKLLTIHNKNPTAINTTAIEIKDIFTLPSLNCCWIKTNQIFPSNNG